MPKAENLGTCAQCNLPAVMMITDAPGNGRCAEHAKAIFGQIKQASELSAGPLEAFNIWWDKHDADGELDGIQPSDASMVWLEAWRWTNTQYERLRQENADLREQVTYWQDACGYDHVKRVARLEAENAELRARAKKIKRTMQSHREVAVAAIAGTERQYARLRAVVEAAKAMCGAFIPDRLPEGWDNVDPFDLRDLVAALAALDHAEADQPQVPRDYADDL